MQVANLFARLGLKVDKAKFDEGLGKINAVRLGLTALGGYLTVKFAGAFVGATKEVFEFGDALNDLSTRTGQSTKFLQELAFAAGGGTEGLSKAQGALDKFGVRLREAVENPTNDTAKALEALGISIDDPRVRLGNLEQILQEVANQFETMPNGAQKNSIAFGLMSKSGLEMSQVLTEFNEKAKVAKEAGLIMTQAQIDEADKGKKQLEAFGAEWDGLKRSAIVEVMPTILEGFEAVRAWLRENGPAIKKAIGTVIEFVVERFKMIVHVIRDNLPFFKAAFQVIGVAVAAIGAALTAVIFAAGAVMKVLTKVGELIGWLGFQFVQFLDWGAEGIDKLIGWFEDMGTAIEEIWDAIVGKIEKVYGAIKPFIDDTKDLLSFVSGDETVRQANMQGQIDNVDAKRSVETARTLLGRGQSQDQVRATLEGIYGKGSNVVGTALKEATKNVTLNAAPITVTINGANETPENLGLLFQQKVQEVQGSMLRDAQAALGGAV